MSALHIKVKPVSFIRDDFHDSVVNQLQVELHRI